MLIPVYINTHAALRGIDSALVELARTVGLGRLEFVRRVALPGALPGFFTGLRLAVTTCWTSLVVLEQINTTKGIGYLMNRARDYGQTDIIVAGLVIYAVLGLVSDGAGPALGAQGAFLPKGDRLMNLATKSSGWEARPVAVEARGLTRTFSGQDCP